MRAISTHLGEANAVLYLPNNRDEHVGKDFLTVKLGSVPNRDLNDVFLLCQHSHRQRSRCTRARRDFDRRARQARPRSRRVFSPIRRRWHQQRRPVQPAPVPPHGEDVLSNPAELKPLPFEIIFGMPRTRLAA